MSKYVFNIENSQLTCTVINKIRKDEKSEITSEPLADDEALKIALKCYMENYDRIVKRNIPVGRYKKDESTILLPSKKGVVEFQNYKETFDKIAEMKEQKRIKNKKVQKGVAVASGIVFGLIAMAQLLKTGNKELTEYLYHDINTHAKFGVETMVEDESLKQDETITQNNANVITIGNGMQVTTEAIEEALKAVDEMSKDAKTTNIEATNAVDETTLAQDVVANYRAGITQTDIEGIYDADIQNSLENYDEIIKKVSEKRGVSEELLRDIIAQESSGGLIPNPVQFEWRFWHDAPLQIYNNQTGEYETIVYSNDEDNWKGKADIIVSQTDLKNKYTNVATGANILQVYGRKYFPNVLWAIQAYNNGETNVDKWLKEIANERGITVEDVLNLSAEETLELIDKYGIRDASGNVYVFQVLKHLDAEEAIDGINQPYYIIVGPNQVATVQIEVKPVRSK